MLNFFKSIYEAIRIANEKRAEYYTKMYKDRYKSWYM